MAKLKRLINEPNLKPDKTERGDKNEPNSTVKSRRYMSPIQNMVTKKGGGGDKCANFKT